MSLLRGFNIWTVRKLLIGYPCLLVFDCATSHLQNTAVQLQTAMILHYCSFPVRPPVNCNWWINLSSDCNERFCRCIATAAQIALSPIWDLARFSLKHGIKRTCQPTLQQDTVPPGYIPTIPRLLPTQTFSSVLTHSEDPQVYNIVTLTENTTAALSSQQKYRKASPLPGTSCNVVWTNRNDDALAYGTVECH